MIGPLFFVEFSNRLGTSAEGANLRARMQSASLISDMQSFKVGVYNLLSYHILCSRLLTL